MSDGDVSLIRDEDLLRRMWQQTEDFSRKKEIRAHMYRLREERLRNLYLPEPTRDGKGSEFTAAQDHVKSFADQSFQSMKSKEVRDAGSPPKEFTYRGQDLKALSNAGWNVEQENKTTDDGHTHVKSVNANIEGRYDVDGGKGQFAAVDHHKEAVTEYHDDNSSLKRNETSSKTAAREHVVRQTDDGTQISSTTSSSTSSSKFQQTSSTRHESVPYVTNDDYDLRSYDTNRNEDSSSVTRRQITKTNDYEQNLRSSDYEQSLRKNDHQQTVRRNDYETGELISRKVDYPDDNTRVIVETRCLPDGTRVTSTKREFRAPVQSTRSEHSYQTRNENRSYSTQQRSDTRDSSSKVIRHVIDNRDDRTTDIVDSQRNVDDYDFKRQIDNYTTKDTDDYPDVKRYETKVNKKVADNSKIDDDYSNVQRITKINRNVIDHKNEDSNIQRNVSRINKTVVDHSKTDDDYSNVQRYQTTVNRKLVDQANTNDDYSKVQRHEIKVDEREVDRSKTNDDYNQTTRTVTRTHKVIQSSDNDVQTRRDTSEQRYVADDDRREIITTRKDRYVQSRDYKDEPQPRDSQPKESQPRGSQPRDSYPRDSQPRDSQPRDSQPRDSYPGDSHPGDAQPRGPQPRGSQPRDSHPSDSHPRDTYPRDTYPRDSHPRDSYPRDSHPRDAHPRDSHPRDSHPRDSHPRDSHPRDSHPRDSQPGDYQPKGFQPKDAQPGDYQPKDSYPRDVQPGDKQPRYTEPKDTRPRDEPRTTEERYHHITRDKKVEETVEKKTNTEQYQTTYQNDFSQKKISNDWSPSHTAWASTLRADTPSTTRPSTRASSPGSKTFKSSTSSLRSSVSPDKTSRKPSSRGGSPNKIDRSSPSRTVSDRHSTTHSTHSVTETKSHKYSTPEDRRPPTGRSPTRPGYSPERKPQDKRQRPSFSPEKRPQDLPYRPSASPDRKPTQKTPTDSYPRAGSPSRPLDRHDSPTRPRESPERRLPQPPTSTISGYPSSPSRSGLSPDKISGNRYPKDSSGRPSESPERKPTQQKPADNRPSSVSDLPRTTSPTRPHPSDSSRKPGTSPDRKPGHPAHSPADDKLREQPNDSTPFRGSVSPDRKPGYMKPTTSSKPSDEPKSPAKPSDRASPTKPAPSTSPTRRPLDHTTKIKEDHYKFIDEETKMYTRTDETPSAPGHPSPRDKSPSPSRKSPSKVTDGIDKRPSRRSPSPKQHVTIIDEHNNVDSSIKTTDVTDNVTTTYRIPKDKDTPHDKNTIPREPSPSKFGTYDKKKPYTETTEITTVTTTKDTKNVKYDSLTRRDKSPKKTPEQPESPGKKPIERGASPTKKAPEQPTSFVKKVPEQPMSPTKKVPEQPSSPTKKVPEQPFSPSKRAPEQPSSPTKKVSEHPESPTKRHEEPTSPSKTASEQPMAPMKKTSEQPSSPTKRAPEQPWSSTKKVPEQPASPTKKGLEQPTKKSPRDSVSPAKSPSKETKYKHTTDFLTTERTTEEVNKKTTKDRPRQLVTPSSSPTRKPTKPVETEPSTGQSSPTTSVSGFVYFGSPRPERPVVTDLDDQEIYTEYSETRSIDESTTIHKRPESLDVKRSPSPSKIPCRSPSPEKRTSPAKESLPRKSSLKKPSTEITQASPVEKPPTSFRVSPTGEPEDFPEHKVVKKDHPDEPENKTPVKAKPPLERRETYEDRCRKILGMTNDTTETVKKQTSYLKEPETDLSSPSISPCRSPAPKESPFEYPTTQKVTDTKVNVTDFIAREQESIVKTTIVSRDDEPTDKKPKIPRDSSPTKLQDIIKKDKTVRTDDIDMLTKQPSSRQSPEKKPVDDAPSKTVKDMPNYPESPERPGQEKPKDIEDSPSSPPKLHPGSSPRSSSSPERKPGYEPSQKKPSREPSDKIPGYMKTTISSTYDTTKDTEEITVTTKSTQSKPSRPSESPTRKVPGGTSTKPSRPGDKSPERAPEQLKKVKDLSPRELSPTRPSYLVSTTSMVAEYGSTEDLEETVSVKTKYIPSGPSKSPTRKPSDDAPSKPYHPADKSPIRKPSHEQPSRASPEKKTGDKPRDSSPDKPSYVKTTTSVKSKRDSTSEDHQETLISETVKTKTTHTRRPESPNFKTPKKLDDLPSKHPSNKSPERKPSREQLSPTKSSPVTKPGDKHPHDSSPIQGKPQNTPGYMRTTESVSSKFDTFTSQDVEEITSLETTERRHYSRPSESPSRKASKSEDYPHSPTRPQDMEKGPHRRPSHEYSPTRSTPEKHTAVKQPKKSPSSRLQPENTPHYMRPISSHRHTHETETTSEEEYEARTHPDDSTPRAHSPTHQNVKEETPHYMKPLTPHRHSHEIVSKTEEEHVTRTSTVDYSSPLRPHSPTHQTLKEDIPHYMQPISRHTHETVSTTEDDYETHYTHDSLTHKPHTEKIPHYMTPTSSHLHKHETATAEDEFETCTSTVIEERLPSPQQIDSSNRRPSKPSDKIPESKHPRTVSPGKNRPSQSVPTKESPDRKPGSQQLSESIRKPIDKHPKEPSPSKQIKSSGTPGYMKTTTAVTSKHDTAIEDYEETVLSKTVQSRNPPPSESPTRNKPERDDSPRKPPHKDGSPERKPKHGESIPRTDFERKPTDKTPKESSPAGRTPSDKTPGYMKTTTSITSKHDNTSEEILENVTTSKTIESDHPTSRPSDSSPTRKAPGHPRGESPSKPRPNSTVKKDSVPKDRATKKPEDQSPTRTSSSPDRKPGYMRPTASVTSKNETSTSDDIEIIERHPSPRSSVSPSRRSPDEPSRTKPGYLKEPEEPRQLRTPSPTKKTTKVTEVSTDFLISEREQEVLDRVQKSLRKLSPERKEKSPSRERSPGKTTTSLQDIDITTHRVKDDKVITEELTELTEKRTTKVDITRPGKIKDEKPKDQKVVSKPSSRNVSPTKKPTGIASPTKIDKSPESSAKPRSISPKKPVSPTERPQSPQVPRASGIKPKEQIPSHLTRKPTPATLTMTKVDKTDVKKTTGLTSTTKQNSFTKTTTSKTTAKVIQSPTGRPGEPRAPTPKGIRESGIPKKETDTKVTRTVSDITMKSKKTSPASPQRMKSKPEIQVSDMSSTKTPSKPKSSLKEPQSKLPGKPKSATTLNTPSDEDDIIIDVQQSKSSRENSPDRICPTPVNFDDGTPRYPDEVREPDDEFRRRTHHTIHEAESIVDDIVEICEDDELFVRKTDIEHLTEEDESLLSVTDKVSRFTKGIDTSTRPKDTTTSFKDTERRVHSDFVEENLKSDECLLSVSEKVNKFAKGPRDTKDKSPARKVVDEYDKNTVYTDDYTKLSVHDKAHLFVETAENVKAPKAKPAPQRVERPDLTNVDEALKSDDCLLSVSDKVHKFVKTAEQFFTESHEVEEKEKKIKEQHDKIMKKIVDDDDDDDDSYEIERTTVSDDEDLISRKTTDHRDDKPSFAKETTSSHSKVKDYSSPNQKPTERAPTVKITTLRSSEAVKKAKALFENIASTTQKPKETTHIKTTAKLTDIGVMKKSPKTDSTIVLHPSVEEGSPNVTDVDSEVEAAPHHPKDRPSSGTLTRPQHLRPEDKPRASPTRLSVQSHDGRRSKSPMRHTVETTTTKTVLTRYPSSQRSESPKHRPEGDKPEKVPGYLRPTKTSQIKEETKVIEESEVSSRRGSGKFGVELRRTSVERSTASSERRRSVEHPCIEDIFDLDLLEQMLEKVVGYEQRRRIRAQIRVARKKSETDHVDSSTYTRTTKHIVTTQKPRSPERHQTRSPERAPKLTPHKAASPERHAKTPQRTIPERSQPKESVPPVLNGHAKEPAKVVSDKRQRLLSPDKPAPKSVLKTKSPMRQASPDKKPRPQSPSKTATPKPKGNRFNEYASAYMKKVGLSEADKLKFAESKKKTMEDKHKTVKQQQMEEHRTVEEQRVVEEYSTVKHISERTSSKDEIEIVQLNGSKRSPSPEKRMSPERKAQSPERIYERSPSPVQKQPVYHTKSEPTSKKETIIKTVYDIEKKIPSKQVQEDKPSWVTNRNLKKITSETRTFSSKKIEEKPKYRAPSPSKVISKPIDVITSSYGPGPLDADGKPLFGIRALRNGASNYQVKGTVIRQEYHSRNGGEPEGTVSVTAYSTEPEELERLLQRQGEQPSRIHGLAAITTTKKFGGDTGTTLTEIHGKEERAAIDQFTHSDRRVSDTTIEDISESFGSQHRQEITGETRRIETRREEIVGDISRDRTDNKTERMHKKVERVERKGDRMEKKERPDDKKTVRQSSVKSLTEKYIKSANESSKAERTTYPKAGLILRTSTMKDSVSSDSSAHAGLTRTDSEHSLGSVEDTVVTTERCEGGVRTVTTTRTHGHVTHGHHGAKGEKVQREERSFLDSNTKVTGVQDILTRMKNADIVIQEGDSSEDTEARALLNKFLGATVLMAGMQSYVTEKPTGKVIVKQETVRTTSGGKTSQTRSLQDFDVDQCWDERLLRKLLDECTDYEQRRRLRARIRTLMAEQEACASAVTEALAAAGETPDDSSEARGESLLLPLLQGLLGGGGERLLAGLGAAPADVVADVRRSLARLRSALAPPAAHPQARALLALADRLEDALDAADRLDGCRQRRPRRRSRAARHTVGVTREELEEARRLVDRDQLTLPADRHGSSATSTASVNTTSADEPSTPERKQSVGDDVSYHDAIASRQKTNALAQSAGSEPAQSANSSDARVVVEKRAPAPRKPDFYRHTVADVDTQLSKPHQPQTVQQPYQPPQPVQQPYQPPQPVQHPYQTSQPIQPLYQTSQPVQPPYQSSQSVQQSYQPSQPVQKSYQPLQSIQQSYQPLQSVQPPYQPSQPVQQPYQLPQQQIAQSQPRQVQLPQPQPLYQSNARMDRRPSDSKSSIATIANKFDSQARETSSDRKENFPRPTVRKDKFPRRAPIEPTVQQKEIKRDEKHMYMPLPPTYNFAAPPTSQDDSKPLNRFSNSSKRLRMKRANTIDIGRPLAGYRVDSDEDDSPTQPKVPEFRPQTENDRKFVAFMKKNEAAEREAAGTLQANWSSRFGNIKNAFESREREDHSRSSSASSARRFWRGADESAINPAAARPRQFLSENSANIIKPPWVTERREPARVNIPRQVQPVPAPPPARVSAPAPARKPAPVHAPMIAPAQAPAPLPSPSIAAPAHPPIPQSPSKPLVVKPFVARPIPVNQFSHAPMSAFKPLTKVASPTAAPPNVWSPPSVINSITSPTADMPPAFPIAPPTTALSPPVTGAPKAAAIDADKRRVASIAATKFGQDGNKLDIAAPYRPTAFHTPPAPTHALPQIPNYPVKSIPSQNELSAPELVRKIDDAKYPAQESYVPKVDAQKLQIEFYEKQIREQHRREATMNGHPAERKPPAPPAYTVTDYTPASGISTFVPLQRTPDIEKARAHKVDYLPDVVTNDTDRQRSGVSPLAPLAPRAPVSPLSPRPTLPVESPHAYQNGDVPYTNGVDDSVTTEHNSVVTRVMRGPVRGSATITTGVRTRNDEGRRGSAADSLRGALDKLSSPKHDVIAQIERKKRETARSQVRAPVHTGRSPLPALAPPHVRPPTIDLGGASLSPGALAASRESVSSESVASIGSSPLSRSGSWHQIATSPKSASPRRIVARAKSMHLLAVPKLYEGGIAREEVTEKKRTVEAYFSGQQQQPRPAPLAGGRPRALRAHSSHSSAQAYSLGRSRTMPTVSELQFLDESNTDDAFEDLVSALG